MNKGVYIKKTLKNGGLFVGLILLTFYILLRDNNISQIISAIHEAKISYILIGILCMCIFISCEGSNLRISLRLMGYDSGFLQGLKYAIVGFFFSSVTPSASGGQPMQVYYMYKDKIQISHSSLCLLIELASYQFVTATFAIIGFICNHTLLSKSLGNMKYLLLLGIVINTTALIIILIAIFSKKIMSKLMDFLYFVLNKLKYKKTEELMISVRKCVKEYEGSAVYFKENKLTILKIVMTTFLQILAIHSIPFWIYKAFGLDGYSLFTVISLQAVLFISVSALPLPGAVGVSESGFMIMFKTLFPAKLLSSSMILSRGISFYLFVLIGGLIIAIIYISKSNIFKSNIFNKKIKNYNKEVVEKVEVRNCEL